MASITSSALMRLFTPANAMSAAAKAFAVPMAFLFTQGISTKPATGSQTKPSKFCNAIEKASEDCCGVPPAASTAAAAAIAEALPTSA
ncbi:Uncharacterised protein [Streptococcus pneumoniae]|nr:Uncharacterised protein [Streptococcus pneumoniae]